MTFNSLTFILFLLIVLGSYHSLRSWTARKALLLASSYLFYAAWNPPFVALLLFSTVVDWFAARRIHANTGGAKRAWLMVSLASNLGVLSYFKYGQFFMDSFVSFMAQLGIQYQAPAMDIILPMGISFYTFQTLSYTLDIYRGTSKPCGSFLDYALYVTFFPQLVAGPIVRAVDFLPQCIEPKRASAAQMGWGVILLIVGLFQKIILSDRLLAPVVDPIYAHPESASFVTAWFGTLAFSGQIFCDFAGYSACGIGVALCLGFALPDNFRYPYAAIGFSDFWRRWHISLSSWLRDYLYISLGGNRWGELLRMRNLMFTMLLGGLWHGAGWHFVVWGGLHGLYLVLERVCQQLFGEQAIWKTAFGRFALGMLTFILVTITWVFFRSPNFATAYSIASAMFGGGVAEAQIGGRMWVAMGIVGAILATHWALRSSSLEECYSRLPRWVVVALLSAMLLAMIFTHGESRGFIYFQF